MYRKLIYLVSFILILSVTSSTSAELVAYWKFDEVSGTIARDSSGNGLEGTLRGNPQWVPGKIGGALKFDGRDDYVDTGYAADLPVWTICTWVLSPDAPSGAMPSGPVHREKNYQINWDHVVTNFRGAAGLHVRGTWHAASFGHLRANTWYHLAATYNRQVLKAYKNGVLITSNPAPSGNPSPEEGTLKFARHSIAPQYFGGIIDDVHIYNNSLTLGQIVDVMEGRNFSDSMAQEQYGGGSGTAEDPYLIYTAKQIDEIGANPNDWDKHFKLMTDINMPRFSYDAALIAPNKSIPYYNFEAISFSGVFDGNGHTISNLIIMGGSYLGLFGRLAAGAEIKNLGVVGVKINGSGDSISYIGGLVGYNEGTVTNCYCTGAVSGHGLETMDFGGLVGSNHGDVIRCFSSGTISGDAGVGGLTGSNWGEVIECNSTGTVNGQWSVGGLVGDNYEGRITDCYSTSGVSGDGVVGGLVGWNSGNINTSNSSGSVNGNKFVGGLVGENNGTVTDCYSTGPVRTNGDYVGGLVGSNYDTITNCYSTGMVSGYMGVGGLEGHNCGTVSHCYSTSGVSGNESVGGLVGENDGTVTDCYSTGPVGGLDVVGGLVGNNKDTIRNCYAIGSIAGIIGIGGLVGKNYTGGDVLVSFWDTQTSGQTTSSGGIGKMTAEMQMSLTFFGWGGWDNEGNGIWTINEGNDYPRLWWENIPGHVIEPTLQFLLTPAKNPNPTEGALLRNIRTNLIWEAGNFAFSHEVYFGDNYESVNHGAAGTFQGTQSETYFIVGLPGYPYPDGLVPGMTYYWRIDEIYDKQTYGIKQRGDVWSFKVASKIPYNPDPPDDSMHEDTWVNLKWSKGDYAVSHDVYFGDNFEDVNIGAESTYQGNQTSTFYVVGVTGFVYPEGLVPGTTYYWRIDEVNDNEPNSPWKGNVWSFSIPPKTAYFPNPADGAELVELVVEFSWTAGFSTALHTVYFGEDFNDVNNATGNFPQAITTYNPGPLEMAKTYYWRVDEFDGVDTHKGDVWNFITQGAVGSPEPTNGALDVKHTPILTWTPGIYADTHEVYFGINKEAVKNASVHSPEYKVDGNLGFESYDPGKLSLDTTYFWRIDEFNNTNPDSPWIGPVWSFTTANFIIVDDFESYNDINEGERGSNRIYLTWVDGYNNPEINGSVVGDYWWGEQTIVHSGNQSMPFNYDNAVGKSEATASIDNLEIGHDWTLEGVRVLSLWFRGSSTNSPETMYVILNGTAAVDHDNPNATQAAIWTEWRIDLQEFADQEVDLTNINSITIGLGNRSNPVAGGRGKMWFDDIRLYRPESQEPAL